MEQQPQHHVLGVMPTIPHLVLPTEDMVDVQQTPLSLKQVDCHTKGVQSDTTLTPFH